MRRHRSLRKIAIVIRILFTVSAHPRKTKEDVRESDGRSAHQTRSDFWRMHAFRAGYKPSAGRLYRYLERLNGFLVPIRLIAVHCNSQRSRPFPGIEHHARYRSPEHCELSG